MPKTISNKVVDDDTQESGSGSSPSSPESGMRRRTAAAAVSSAETSGPRSRPKYVVPKRTIVKKQSSKTEVCLTRALWATTNKKLPAQTGMKKGHVGAPCIHIHMSYF